MISESGERQYRVQDDWNPEFCGDLDIEIEADGTWLHGGHPIERAELIALFAGLMRREADGEYYLVTPVEKVRIRVADVPFLVTALSYDGNDATRRLLLATNVGDEVAISPDHPIRIIRRGERERPYIEVRTGLDALISRPVYYRLVDLIVEVNGQKGWQSGGDFVALQTSVEAADRTSD